MDWQMSAQMQHEAKPEINKMVLYQTNKKCLCNYSTLLSLKQFFEPDHCWPSEGCKGKDNKKVWSKWIYIYIVLEGKQGDIQKTYLVSLTHTLDWE